MCGRIVCHSSLDEISAASGATLEPNATAAYQPSYNIPPSQPVPMIYSLDDERRLLMAKWGLLPHWVKDESFAFKAFNARAETVREKPSFKNAFQYRRCLVPVNGYYEWQRQGSEKLPYYFSRQDGGFLWLAGLFEIWQEEQFTCTVITTNASQMAGEVHPRMPVVLRDEDCQTWLNASPDEAYGVLGPAPDELLSKYRVNQTVNNVRNDGSELIAPLAEDAQTA